MDEFQVGDVVQLKSGGPRMTVRTVNEGKIGLLWFAEGDTTRMHSADEIAPALLCRADAAPKPVRAAAKKAK